MAATVPAVDAKNNDYMNNCTYKDNTLFIYLLYGICILLMLYQVIHMTLKWYTTFCRYYTILHFNCLEHTLCGSLTNRNRIQQPDRFTIHQSCSNTNTSCVTISNKLQ